ncbi:MAG TPA: maleylpyruvate isomerase family mycothiol-dependent enzyme [Streptosporangiaceae bacterium]
MTTTTGEAPSFTDVLTALRNSHDRLATAVSPLTSEQVGGPSYHDWTIAQVASHLGSGAEVFGLFLAAGAAGTEAPGIEQFRPIWDRWNAKPAPQQVQDAVVTDAALLDQASELAPAERESWQLDVFGTHQDLPGLLRMRLSEHAMHTWDIVVALDPAATVADDAIELIVGNLAPLAARAGKGSPEPVTVHVITSGPEREFLLELTPDGVKLTPAPGPGHATATLRLPAEAFVRLLYGRLDPAHTPGSVEAENVELDTLRRSFPGF